MERNDNVNQSTAIIVSEDVQSKNEHRESGEEKFGGIGEIIGRICKSASKLLKKANKNFFEVRKANERPIRISLVVSILLLVFLSVPSIILLVVGLFCGYKYSISGPNIKGNSVNNIFEEVSKSADNIKQDFKGGYEK